MRYYYYTRWTFKVAIDGNSGAGPFHSTWESDSPPEEFFSGTRTENLRAFYYRQFDTAEEMKAFWEKVDKGGSVS